jgi:hypothetical protein
MEAFHPLIHLRVQLPVWVPLCDWDWELAKRVFLDVTLDVGLQQQGSPGTSEDLHQVLFIYVEKIINPFLCHSAIS